ncbi:FadR/GntR family transcriptional regulator [Tranquillimonas alkanivorans]|uniref:Transcriptional regulator, GntR family n=1 Tax=Tranquillimonas alkanivorans TaxID=441119 RepID=A0A1I5Q220_9RHOB|nr:FadR/GntR family transcriptional regulator [Tranquillimonas alkanivorans]SFP40283.1 transcriptional regulator, GntR family [Tranquillimonas alkanivorans]
MAGKPATAQGAGERRSLVQSLASQLRASILSGEVPVGVKLPSEAMLTAQHGVSRTVVREAISALRSEGLVEARQGAGVFVIANTLSGGSAFDAVDLQKLSNLLEMMEFRIAIEVEAAGLAAARRSPAQEATIIETLEALDKVAAAGGETGPLDFDFHLAVARATNNPRFEQFLESLGGRAIPRARLGGGAAAVVSGQYYAQLRTEHHSIADAISAGDEDGARQAMRRHLTNGLRRYRALRRKAAMSEH